MIRVVLDTNVVVSAIRAERGPLAVIREAWLAGRFQVSVSDPLLEEVERTLAKPYFADQVGKVLARHFVDLLQETALVHPIIEQVAGVATHPEDDRILATAKNARAQFLVTGDKGLLALGTCGVTRVIGPRAFADYLDSLGDI